MIEGSGDLNFITYEPVIWRSYKDVQTFGAAPYLPYRGLPLIPEMLSKPPMPR